MVGLCRAERERGKVQLYVLGDCLSVLLLQGVESVAVFPTQVQLPLEVGMKAKCKWRDGVYRLARVVDRREAQDSKDPAKWKYYVHYYGCELA